MYFETDIFQQKNIEQEYLGDSKVINEIEPIVSVHVITYNHVDYIEQCIYSILSQQTSFAFEIILGEDDSTDGTRELCQKLAEQNQDKIRLFLRSSEDKIFINGVKTGKFNNVAGMVACRGKYIAVCEGDDYWTDPLKLQSQFDFLETNTDCVLCHHWQTYAVQDEAGIFKEIPAPKEGQGYQSSKISEVKEIFSNKLRVKTRTLFFRNLNISIPEWYLDMPFGDVPLSMILGEHGNFGFIDREMACYRKTGTGLSSIGKGQYLNFLNHHLKWILIWEQSLIHFDFEYYREGRTTILNFYHSILKKYKYKVQILFKVFRYSIFQSRLPFSKSVEINFRLIVMVMNWLKSPKRLKKFLRDLDLRR
jgi:glycosyltransferase involved in cell wall biosynthesis